MQEFLKTVAYHYAKQALCESEGTGLPASLPLSHYLFCFPNRRCGLFFANYLKEAFGGPCIVPSITTINELFGLFSQRQVPDRTTLLFRLYSIYRQLSQRADKEEFDQFVFWGDMMLADFDDADKYLVDADALFKNVKDLKDIDAEFAGYDPEIVQVIQSFWRNYKPAECPDDAKREAFGQTWNILRDLYHAFRADLAKDNLAYEGMLEREVIEGLYDKEIDPATLFPNPQIQKVVFVGLTAISKAERKLMLKLKVNNLAEFCWDYADSRLKRKGSKATSAAYFTDQNLLDFPNSLSDEILNEGLVPESERQYSLYAVPSGVGQTQMARNLLLQWKEEIVADPLHTAVVLPDEKLLIPMLYAVPESLGTFNVTMGYGLKETPIATFVELLANLQEAIREKADATTTFYYKPVLALLSHNFARSLAAKESHDLIEKITRNNLYQVETSEFSNSDFLRLVFRAVHNANETIQYLLEILDYLLKKAQEEIESDAKKEEEPSLFDENAEVIEPETDDNVPHFSVTDHEFLFHYNRTLEKLAEEIRCQKFSFTPRTLFLLLQKLISGVSVPFSGEPLQGIQLMGVLETRGMDFDNVIILSMNEGVFPAKPVSNTFIPMSLRNAFEMPTQKHRDAVFAYHFYRLISRAKRVAMIYDSRTEGTQVGEESRYVKQLRYLMGQDDLQPIAINNDIRITEEHPFQIQKTPEIMKRLQMYLGADGKRFLSATALNEYIQCPLSFYFSYVECLREDEEVSEGVDNLYFGDILHDALSHLYEKSEGKRVDADLLDKYIQNPEGEITKQILLSFENKMGIKKLEGYNLLVSHILVKYAVEILRHDKKRCPFIYLKGEAEHKLLYPLNDQIQVRIKCIYDRLEKNVIGEPALRLIDYKTGSSSRGGKLNIKDIPELFKQGGKASHEAFQVMMYCLMLKNSTPQDIQRVDVGPLPSKITPHLFFVRDFKAGTDTPTMLNMGKNEKKETIYIEDFSPYIDKMTDGFNQLLTSIFSPNGTFTQCENNRHCIYCKFNTICKR